MVSSFWKACADGDLQKVLELLDSSGVDVELKDHAGVTPLIEAVKNNRIDIVKVLLDRGANPTNPSSQGHLPEHYTSERAILHLLHPPQNETLPGGVPPQQTVYNSESANDLREPFYTPPPPGDYPYFPTINASMPSGNDVGAYYPSSQPQPGGDASSNGSGNLPPLEIARMIPCRYFPACRYGAQCIFAHPQTPYYPAPIPLHYPTYDSGGNPFMHSYFQPPPSFPQPDGIHLTPLSPPPPPSVMHVRSSSEVVSPSQAHFTPNGAPPLPYGPITSPYPHSGQMPVPLSMPPLPPLHHPSSHPQAGPQSPQNIYNASTSPVLPFVVVHQDLPGPSAPPLSSINYPDIPLVKLPLEQTENYNIHPRETNRRGAGRRPSVGSRKPPCLFFPAGRCKNGNDCRFPHVITDNTTMPTPSPLPPNRGGGPRPRNQANGHNGFPTVETKLGAMSIRDDAPRSKNAFEVTGRSQVNDIGNRPRYSQGGKSQHGVNINNSHLHKKVAPKQLRIPNPDEFPVLAGTITPPSRPSGVWNGQAGSTAAQILQFPSVRKEGNKEPNMQDTAADPTPNPSPKDQSAEVNDAPHENLKSIYEQAPVEHINTRPGPAMSFAAATSGPVGVSKEVSVSA